MVTKEKDVIDRLIPTSTHDWLLFFTNRGRVFRLKAYEVPAASLQAKGVAAVNLLQLQPEEKITSIIKLAQSSEADNYLFMATIKGTVKKTALKDFANIRTNGLNAINLDEGDELRWIQETNGSQDIIISTSAGQAVRFNENHVRAMGRAARGVRGVRLRPDDNVVGMDVVGDDKQKLLVIAANGYGKKTEIANFEVKNRGGIGVKAAVVTAKTGPIVSVKTLPDNVCDALMISNGGQTIRVSLKDIPTLGRTTQGVRIMKMSAGDSVASVGLMEDNKEEEEE
jgi:DNA gyrase subunit A